jgi:hypothetical protein
MAIPILVVAPRAAGSGLAHLCAAAQAGRSPGPAGAVRGAGQAPPGHIAAAWTELGCAGRLIDAVLFFAAPAQRCAVGSLGAQAAGLVGLARMAPAIRAAAARAEVWPAGNRVQAAVLGRDVQARVPGLAGRPCLAGSKAGKEKDDGHLAHGFSPSSASGSRGPRQGTRLP